MKQLLFLLLILAGLNPLFAQTDIVGGGGECKVDGDPDLHPTLGDANVNNCWLAVDVTTGNKYWYNPLGAVGNRWNIVPATDDQNLTLTGTTLAIEDGNSVDLSALQDGTGTDDQNLTLTGTTLAIEDGNSVDLATLDTDDQTLSLLGTNLTISEGNTVDLGALSGVDTDDQNLSLTGTTLSIDDGNSVDLSALQDGTGTDDQNLTLTGTTLAIEAGNSVDLATLNTDDQKVDTFSLTGTTLTLEIENDGQVPHTVDLSALQDGTGTDDQNITLTGTTLAIEAGNSVDLSALQDGTGTDDQNLTLTGTTLAIEAGNSVDLATLNTDDQKVDTFSLTGTTLTLEIENDGQVPHTVDLSALQDGTGTDDQNLTLTGGTLSIEGGNSVDLSGLADGTGTDDQNLTLTGTTLAIEDGNSVDLATLDTDDQKVDAFSLTGTTLTLEIENDGQVPHTVDLSALQDGTGTDDQTLTLTGTTLAIEDGNSVDLATLDTDQQTLSLSGTNLIISNGNSVSLIPIKSKVTNTIPGNRIATHNAGDGFEVAINETVTDIALLGNLLSYDREDGTTTTVNLSSVGTGTDDQNLTLTGTTLSIEDGNSVDLSGLGGGGGSSLQTFGTSANTTITPTASFFLYGAGVSDYTVTIDDTALGNGDTMDVTASSLSIVTIDSTNYSFRSLAGPVNATVTLDNEGARFILYNSVWHRVH